MARKESTEIIKHPERARALAPFENFERFFDEAFRRPFSLIGPSWWPRLREPVLEAIPITTDVYEEANDVVVKAELPGMEKKDINLDLADNVLTISGEKKKEEKTEEKDYYRVERSYGSFTRSFAMPEEVQPDKAKASFKNGVLEVRIPKSEEARKKAVKLEIE